MHVKIQGGGDGVYANTGSCSAAAMYCEHERQQLVEKGIKPETFFHQYSDFVSTAEVINKIDNNKKKLRKEDAKFFVMTVSPSADEQRKMGSSLDERIAAFKQYIRHGVMSEYANNFERGLTAADIMYYAYIHVDRGDKTGEQMHAHIIVSRRNMDNSISLSPKSNHRSGKGVIAHGFNRDRFNNSCEKAFDTIMGYTRYAEESYAYRNAVKNGDYQDIANVTAMAAESSYGVNLSDWDKLVSGELDKEAVSITETSKNETTSTVVAKPVVNETKIPTHQSSNTGVIAFAKKAWNFASGFWGNKSEEKNKKDVSVPDKSESGKQQESVKGQDSVQQMGKLVKRENPQDGLYIFRGKGKEYYSAVWFNAGKKLFADKIDEEDVGIFFKAKNSDNSEFMNKVVKDMTDKYFLVPLAKRIAEDFQKKNKSENITSIRALHGYNGYNWIKYEVDNDWHPGYRIPDRFADEINSLPAQLVNVMFDALNSLLVDAFPTVACSGTPSKKKRKREENKGRSR